MSDPHPPLKLQRSLKRAPNIVSTSGRIVQEPIGIDNGRRHASLADKRRGFGASIRRKFKELTTSPTLGRSKSLNDASNASASLQKDGVARSQSSVRTQPESPSLLALERGMHIASPTRLESQTAPLDCSTLPQPMEDIAVPDLIQRGTLMTKVSAKRHKNVMLTVEPDLGQIVWQSHRQKISMCRIICTDKGLH